MKAKILISILIIGLMVGCAADPAYETASNEVKTEQSPTSSDDDGARPQTDDLSKVSSEPLITKQLAPEAESDKKEAEPDSKVPTKRMIVRNADLGLESAAPRDAQKKIGEIAESLEGYIVLSSTSNSSDSLDSAGQHRIVIRVPAEKFTQAVNDIKKTADRVVRESVSGKDITEQFVDIQARLKTKKALEERFLEIMKQAKTVQNALNVQRELAKVRSEIEVIEGRKRLLESQASLSKITVNIGPPNTISTSSSGFWYQLKDAVSDGIEGALTVVLFLVRMFLILLPLLLIIVLPLYLVFIYAKKKYKKYLLSKALKEEAAAAGLNQDIDLNEPEQKN